MADLSVAELNGADKGKTNKVIGSYRIGKVLGTGSYGHVRLGTHVVTGEQFAIKTLKDAQNRKGIQREIAILKLLDHPNIVKLHDVIEEQKTGTFYLILELASGGELFDYIVARGKLKEKEARKFFRQVLSGVEYCHSNLVIHRDLKPENLLLDNDGNIKINDFGFANIIVPGERFSTFCGSVSYVAPEIIKNIKYVGPEIDIWSLGVILYTLVCGRLPWPETSDGSPAITNIIEGDYDKHPLQNLSTGCQDLLARILVPEPQPRATMAEIRQHPWVNEGYPSPPPCLVQQFDPITTINEEILTQLIAIGFEEEDTRALLLTNARSPAVSTYHLLHKKWQSNANRPNSPTSTRLIDDMIAEAFDPVRRGRTGSISASAASPPPASPTSSRSSIFGSGLAQRFGYKAGVRASVQITSQNGHPTEAVTARDASSSMSQLPLSARQTASEKAAKRHTLAPFSPSLIAEARASASGNGNQSAPSTMPVPRTMQGSPGISPAGTNLSLSGSPTRGSVADRRKSSRLMGSLSKLFTKPDKLKEVKGVFSVDTTTTQPPDQIMAEIKRVLSAEMEAEPNSVTYKLKGYSFHCTYPAHRLKFHMEVCRIKNLDLNGIKLKRIKGDLWIYKDTCQKLLAKLQF